MCDPVTAGTAVPFRAKLIVVGGPAGYPNPAGLPDQPGSLLRAVYRWCAADWAKNADSLPGKPAPPPTRADLQSSAFQSLGLMLSSGVTSPAPAVQLKAFALIPGTRVITGAHNAAGRPGIAVAITGNPAQVGFIMDEIIFDARTYQEIGGVLVQPRAGGGAVTLSTTMQWQAYYDATGHRLWARPTEALRTV
jgi:hypothetical protein